MIGHLPSIIFTSLLFALALAAKMLNRMRASY